MSLCKFNCKMLTIVLIVHTLLNQLLLQLSVHPFVILQVSYRHIEYVQFSPQLFITDRSKAVVLIWSLLAVLVSEFR